MNSDSEQHGVGAISSSAVVRPLPWKITSDGLELDITDANGKRVIYGNVNRGIECDDPEIPVLLGMAIEYLNRSNIQAER